MSTDDNLNLDQPHKVEARKEVRLVSNTAFAQRQATHLRVNSRRWITSHGSPQTMAGVIFPARPRHARRTDSAPGTPLTPE
jgi:hypothetical protein